MATSDVNTDAGGKQLKTSRGAKSIKKMAPKEAVGGAVRGPRLVSSFVPKLTSKAFEKCGFPISALLLDWAEIAGADLAGFTRPEKLTWPRRQYDKHKDAENSGLNGEKAGGATLVLRVDGPRAIEVQHSATQIMEHINAYFGYRAVTELRFLQAPITNELPRQTIQPKPARTNSSPKPSRSTNAQTANGQPASSLEASLARLAGHLESAE